MVRSLIHVRAATTGDAAAGVCTLASPWWYGSTSASFRIPFGMTAKVIDPKVSGAEFTFFPQFTHDITVSSPTWASYDDEKLASAGQIGAYDKTRPMVFHSYNGKQGLRIYATTSATGTASYLNFELELSDEETM